jgi:hypothetical protein
MLTIDWKERLNKDTDDYLQNKLPKGDYDFEIIFIAYPERINGKIPPEVISHVSNRIIAVLGKNHEKQLPFFRTLWDKKGDYGKTAFIAMMSKLVGKKPAVYIPLVETAMAKGNLAELHSILEKVMLPLIRKAPDKYLGYAYKWDHSSSPNLRKATISMIIKLLRKDPQLIPAVITHYSNQWIYPLGEGVADHVALLKALSKLDMDQYLDVYRKFGHERDPQTVEILCGSVVTWDADIEGIVTNWTRSGNARVKKAATTALRFLNKRKKA